MSKSREQQWETIEGTSDFWNPEKEGEMIEGEIIDIITGSFGLQYIIQLSDKTTIMTPSHKMLQSKLVKCNKGDYVKIQFSEEIEPTKKGRSPTKIYEVQRLIPNE